MFLFLFYPLLAAAAMAYSTYNLRKREIELLSVKKYMPIFISMAFFEEVIFHELLPIYLTAKGFQHQHIQMMVTVSFALVHFMEVFILNDLPTSTVKTINAFFLRFYIDAFTSFGGAFAFHLFNNVIVFFGSKYAYMYWLKSNPRPKIDILDFTDIKTGDYVIKKIARAVCVPRHHSDLESVKIFDFKRIPISKIPKTYQESFERFDEIRHMRKLCKE